jgi:hypothetical protein
MKPRKVGGEGALVQDNARSGKEQEIGNDPQKLRMELQAKDARLKVRRSLRTMSADRIVTWLQQRSHRNSSSGLVQSEGDLLIGDNRSLD